MHFDCQGSAILDLPPVFLWICPRRLAARPGRKAGRPTTWGGSLGGRRAANRSVPQHRRTASGPSKNPGDRESSAGEWNPDRSSPAESLAIIEPGWSQGGLLASGSRGPRCIAWRPQPSAAPSHSRYAREQWPLAAVVAGYSGASAADSHGLPFWSRLQPGHLQRGQSRGTPGGCQARGREFDSFFRIDRRESPRTSQERPVRPRAVRRR